VARYMVRRVVAALVLVAVVSSGALLLTLVAPGDFASELFGGATVDAIAAERARYGLDRPVTTQFVDWLGRAARFDFGVSLIYHRPVAELVRQRALNTSILAVARSRAATALGLPAGIVTGSRRRG
jgi:peptide/nickel transport system permease protein